MAFLTRLAISIAIAALIPAFFVDYSRPSGWEIHLLATATFSWIILVPLSWYSSPMKSLVATDGLPIPVHARRSTLRSRVGAALTLTALAGFMLFLLFASYDFASRYEWAILGPDMFAFFVGVYLYGTNMCVYCARLNPPKVRKCEGCGNALRRNWLQKPERAG